MNIQSVRNYMGKAALDSLLILEGEHSSRLAWLLQFLGKINGKNVLKYIDRLKSIAALELQGSHEKAGATNCSTKFACRNSGLDGQIQ